MADITMLILDDHDWFREQFAKLDELQAQTPPDQRALKRVWRPLAEKLDVHAYIEEKIFYPQLLTRGGNDAEGETLDAIGDHNDIRDGVRDATRPGSPPPNGGQRLVAPEWPTTITWLRKNAKAWPTFAGTLRSGCVKRSDASTASSWRSIRPPAAYRSRIATRRSTSTGNRQALARPAPTIRWASAASNAKTETTHAA